MTPPQANRIRFLGVVQSRDAAVAKLHRAGDAVLVKRGRPRLFVLRCPCGCEENLLINLDGRAGAAWQLYRTRKGLTLFPSYWRDDRCGAHFIVWSNHIWWCAGSLADESNAWEVSADIEQRVQDCLSDESFLSIEFLAERLGMIPWEVLQACRQLVKAGRAIADKWPANWKFRRVITGSGKYFTLKHNGRVQDGSSV